MRTCSSVFDCSAIMRALHLLFSVILVSVSERMERRDYSDRNSSVKWVANQPWEVVVIGGGATGLGAAVEAAARGYRTLLVERSDFAKETSSRSTKLVHGGVRYLEQMNVTLVLDALRERGHMLRNAPHLVHDLSLRCSRLQLFFASLLRSGTQSV